MSEQPAIDYKEIAQSLVAKKADIEFQSLQWESLANTLQTQLRLANDEIVTLKAQIASAPAPDPGEPGPVTPGDVFPRKTKDK